MSDKKKEFLQEFFEDGDLVEVIDAIARRYGKTPSEVIRQSVFDFNFDTAVMFVAMNREQKRVKEMQDKAKAGQGGGMKNKSFSELGFKVTKKG